MTNLDPKVQRFYEEYTADVDFDLPQAHVDRLLEDMPPPVGDYFSPEVTAAQQAYVIEALRKVFSSPRFFGALYLYEHKDPDKPVPVGVMHKEVVPKLLANPLQFRQILESYGLESIQLYVQTIYASVLATIAEAEDNL